MGFPTVLFLMFLVLKLTSVIDWSWWAVFSPMIVQLILFIAIEAWKEIDPIGFVRFWK
jgi:hypothetical protein